jgi:hypothetical protein
MPVHTTFLVLLCAATAWLGFIAWITRHEE